MDWGNAFTSLVTGGIGGYLTALITNRANQKMHAEQMKQQLSIIKEQDRKNESKLIKQKVHEYLKANPGTREGTLMRIIRGENHEFSGEWSMMVCDTLDELLIEEIVEVSNPDEEIGYMQLYKVKK
ncbi:hypothetical protein OCF13_26090 [Bacillus tropicus]|uniref:hypothetical protein n=1 Tax=Bacillus cereus group TaxID=86661 RepID=UPI001963D3FA|nr:MULTISPECIES: hypothetical protein [Bacillus cereus group]MBM6770540.1 hypothetical protein [Bacillus cereus]MCC2340200.1 hypothetical protein [Bacillus tropicus]MCU5425395.1 hypothetical protein [Bacillus tropicus]MCU5595264.1 hypothetical protein [Bacillus mobilis]MCU5736747.1 hypothetical protein [Bacillus mobilis]